VCKVIGPSGPHVAEASKNKPCTGERTGLPASWIIPMLVSAADAECVKSGCVEAVYKKMRIARRKCRTVPGTFMIKINSTRCKLLSQDETHIFMQKCFTTAGWIEHLYVLA